MIEWMVTGSALILLVLALRALIRDRVSPRLRYALWGLVLLRLLIPGTIWESRASVMTPVAAQEAYQAVEQIPRYVRDRPDGWVDIGHESGYTSIPGEIVEAGEPIRYGWPERAEAPLPELKRQVSIRNALLLVWLAGSALTGTFLLVVNLKFDHNLKRERRTLMQYRGRWVFVMDGLATPCLFGLFRPAVYLTPGVAADDADREHVLAHEYAHFRQGDHLWAALRGVCLALHWYNPLVWLAAALSRRDCELSCDEGAVRLLGEERRADYGRTLVGLVARRTTAADLARCATTMTGGKSALKERVALLARRPRTTAVMAVLVAAACVGIAACTFTGAAAEEGQEQEVPETSASQDTPAPSEEWPASSPDGYAAAAEELLEETLRGSGDVQDCRVNSVKIREWRFDPDTGDRQAAFDAELMVLVPPRAHNIWMAGNTVAADSMEDDFYRDFFGWLVFWRQGYLTYDGGTGAWSIPEMGTGGYNLDQYDRTAGEDASPGRWLRFAPVPENLPTEVMDLDRPAEEQGDWLLLAQTPGFDIALYRSAWDDQHVYLRVTNQSFQRFDRDLSGMELLPTLEVVDGDADIPVRALWRRYEGTYFNGTDYEPGVVAEQVFYDWDESRKYWTEWILSTQPALGLTEDLPALEDLPTRVVSPGTPEAKADIWLAAELRSDDIAVYYAPEPGHNWLRYGETLQAVDFAPYLVAMPQMLLPGLRFEDLDGDGEKELAVFYSTGHGTGVSIWSLTVLEWDGESWTAHTARLAEDIVRAFETGHTLTRHLDENYVTVGFHDSTVDVDMEAMFGGYTAWKDEPLYAELTGAVSSYNMESYGLSLTLAGELRPASYDPTTSYGFEYTCNVYYEADGTFRSTWGYLDTEYPWTPAVDESLLTPAFRDILRDFIDQCRSEGMEDFSTERFAICDVNGDGKNELITQRNNTYMAGQAERVYDAGGNELLAAFSMNTYYDNGYVTAGWSHNQGVSGDKLWPYTLYRYDSSTGKYVQEASVDGWDKSIRETYLAYDNKDGDYYIDQSVIPFPDDVDKDGDGFVYYIITEDGGYAPAYGEPVDYADYALWAARYLGANRLDVTYYPLTEENIALIG